MKNRVLNSYDIKILGRGRDMQGKWERLHALFRLFDVYKFRVYDPDGIWRKDSF